MTNHIDDKMEPCPFCGSDGLAYVHEECGFHIAGCSDDDCIAHSVAYDFVSQETAIAAWNRRAQPAGEGEPVAPRPYPGHTGGKVQEYFGFDGGSLTIKTTNTDADGTGWLCFEEDGLEWEQDQETGKDYRILNLPNSELIFMRDTLNTVFPCPLPSTAGAEREALDLICATATKADGSEPRRVYVDRVAGKVYEVDASPPREPETGDREAIKAALQSSFGWPPSLHPGPAADAVLALGLHTSGAGSAEKLAVGDLWRHINKIGDDEDISGDAWCELVRLAKSALSAAPSASRVMGVGDE